MPVVIYAKRYTDVYRMVSRIVFLSAPVFLSSACITGVYHTIVWAQSLYSCRQKLERDGRLFLAAAGYQTTLVRMAANCPLYTPVMPINSHTKWNEQCVQYLIRCPNSIAGTKVMAKLPVKRTLGIWLADTPNGAGGPAHIWPAPQLSSLPPGSFVNVSFVRTTASLLGIGAMVLIDGYGAHK